MSAPDIKNFEVIAPDDATVAAFENVATPLLIKVQHNHVQINSISAIRDTLLPRLISGKLRLPEAEAALKEVSA